MKALLHSSSAELRVDAALRSLRERSGAAPGVVLGATQEAGSELVDRGRGGRGGVRMVPLDRRAACGSAGRWAAGDCPARAGRSPVARGDLRSCDSQGGRGGQAGAVPGPAVGA